MLLTIVRSMANRQICRKLSVAVIVATKRLIETNFYINIYTVFALSFPSSLALSLLYLSLPFIVFSQTNKQKHKL